MYVMHRCEHHHASIIIMPGQVGGASAQPIEATYWPQRNTCNSSSHCYCRTHPCTPSTVAPKPSSDVNPVFDATTKLRPVDCSAVRWVRLGSDGSSDRTRSPGTERSWDSPARSDSAGAPLTVTLTPVCVCGGCMGVVCVCFCAGGGGVAGMAL